MINEVHNSVATVLQTPVHIPFIKILIIAIWGGLMGVDMQNFYTHLHRPLVSGLIVGLILGNVHVGLIAGATIELSFLGLVPVAGSQPPNPVLAGILGSAFAIIMSADPKIVVGLVVPFAVIMSVLITLLYTSFAFLSNRADTAAEEENYDKMARQPLAGLVYLFILYFLMTILPLTLGSAYATELLKKIPPFIIGGLSLAGGAMPAIGFAILLTIMLRKAYIAYLGIGFVLAAYLHLPATAIAILAVSLAAIDFFIKKQTLAQLPASGSGSSQAVDEEEGI